MSSSGTNSRDAATGNKIAKKQHSEAQANITSKKSAGSPGSSGTTVIMDSSISTPTTRFSVDTVNSTTTTHSLNPIMTPHTISSSRSDQGPLIDRRLERRNMSPRRNCSAAAATTKALRDLFETIEITQARIDSCSTTATHSLNQKTIPTTVPATETIYQRCAQVLPESIKQVPLREDVQQSPNIKHIQYTVRFMVVGKKGVADVFSTDGVDIDVRWCKIDIGNDKWTIETGLLLQINSTIRREEIFTYKTCDEIIKHANCLPRNIYVVWQLN